MPTHRAKARKTSDTPVKEPGDAHRSQTAEVVTRIYKSKVQSPQMPAQPLRVPEVPNEPLVAHEAPLPQDKPEKPPESHEVAESETASVVELPELENEPRIEIVNRRLYTAGSILTGVFLGAVLMIGIFALKPDRNESASRKSEPVTAVTPSPTPSLTKQDVTLEVLNGSGIRGAAGRAAVTLEELGYTVVITGNADTATYTASILDVREDFTDTFSAYIPDFQKEFGITGISGSFDDSTASARLTVGRESAAR